MKIAIESEMPTGSSKAMKMNGSADSVSQLRFNCQPWYFTITKMLLARIVCTRIKIMVIGVWYAFTAQAYLLQIDSVFRSS